MTSTPNPSDILARWPTGRPVGLLALTSRDGAGWAERASSDPAVGRWWECVPENVFVGPSVEAPFRRVLMLEVADAAAATTLLGDLVNLADAESTTVLTGTPMPGLARFLMGAMSGVLRRLPEPRVPDDAPRLDAPRNASDVNPSAEQIEAFQKLPARQPVMVLNLNLHKEQGINPDSGEAESGRAIADNYFRRGIRTFSRLGARAVWAGACRGAVLDGLGVGTFDQIGLVHYTSRDHFAKLIRIGGAEGWERYREAGLERSWVIHCKMTASSEP